MDGNVKRIREERTFACRNCGTIIFIEAGGRHENQKLDKRSVFCCEKCRRQFWRKTKHVRQLRQDRAQQIEAQLKG